MGASVFPFAGGEVDGGIGGAFEGEDIVLFRGWGEDDGVGGVFEAGDVDGLEVFVEAVAYGLRGDLRVFAGVERGFEQFPCVDVGLAFVDVGFEFFGPDVGRGGHDIILVVEVVGECDTELAEVGLAFQEFAAFDETGTAGQAHGGEDADDGDDHEEFDEGESLWVGCSRWDAHVSGG